MLISCMPFASSVAEMFGVGTAIIAAVWAYREWCRDKKNRCADVYGQLLAAFTENEMFHAYEDLIENGRIDEIGHNRSGGVNCEHIEDLDKVLVFLNQVCYLRENNMIGDKEFQVFRYPIFRTLRNGSVLKYIEDLQHIMSEDFAFDALMAYAEVVGKMSKGEGIRELTETAWRDYLTQHYCGWTKTAVSVYSRVNTVCERASATLDGFVETIDIASKHIDDVAKLFSDKSAAQISSLRTAVRHCCMAKHGVWPEN